MREEVLEETIRFEMEQLAEEKFGVPCAELPAEVQAWLRSAVTERLLEKDAPPAVSPETAEEE